MSPYDAVAAVAPLSLKSSEPRVRVMLLLGSLDGGGAERVAVNLFNRCDARDLDLRLGLLRRTGPYLDEVDGRRVTALPDHRGRLSDWARTPRDLARMITEVKPQVLMTFGMGVDVLTWLALARFGSDRPQWICRQDSNPDAEIANLTGNPVGRAAVAAFTRHIHRVSDGFVAVAKDLAAQVDQRAGPTERHAQTIYNPIDIATIQRLAEDHLAHPPERPFIVTAGRLVRQKGYDILIEAFAKSGAARDLDLVILGQGPLEGALRTQAAALGVGDRVKFPGFQINPWAWFARARLFVLSSRWEGFGNVVAEALACGVPTLVTDCDFGPREQVEHTVSGWICRSEDPAAMTAALDTVLTNDITRKALGLRGRKRAEAFDIDVIARQYTQLFLQVAARQKSSHRFIGWAQTTHRRYAAWGKFARPVHSVSSHKAAPTFFSLRENSPSP